MNTFILYMALLATAALPSLSSHIEARELHKDVSQVNKPATIKILLEQKKDKILLEVTGRYHIYNPADGVLVDTGILGKRDYIHVGPEGIQWANLMPIGLEQFRIMAGDSQSKLLVNGVQYLGCIEAYLDHGRITLISEIDVENYLKSILAPVFTGEKNTELLDAIAITARTNTYYTVSRNPQAPWHVTAEEVGYQGFALANQNAKLDRSIDNTKHMVDS